MGNGNRRSRHIDSGVPIVFCVNFGERFGEPAFAHMLLKLRLRGNISNDPSAKSFEVGLDSVR